MQERTMAHPEKELTDALQTLKALQDDDSLGTHE